jgi:hypothetical protein
VRRRSTFRRALSDLPDADVIAHLAFYGVVMWDQTHDGPPTDADCAHLADVLLRT